MSAHSQHAGRFRQAASPDTGRAGIRCAALLENSLEKHCAKCAALKPLTAFYKNRRKRDGRSDQCAECLKANSQSYRKRNVEACNARTAKWRDKNRQHTRDYSRKWALEHREQRREIQNAWARRTQAGRKNYAKHGEKYRAKMKTDREALGDQYVIQQLRQRTVLRKTDFPQELVELKRAHLKIHRQLKTKK